MYRQKSAYELKNKGDFEKLPLADMKKMHMKFLEDDYAKAESRGDKNFGNKEVEEIIVRTELKIKPDADLTPDAKKILENLRSIDFTNGLDDYKYGLNNLRAIQPNANKPQVQPTLSLDADMAEPIVKIPEQTNLADTLPPEASEPTDGSTNIEHTEEITNKYSGTTEVTSTSTDMSKSNSTNTSSTVTSSNTSSTSTSSDVSASETSGESHISAQTSNLLIKPRTDLTQTESAPPGEEQQSTEQPTTPSDTPTEPTSGEEKKSSSMIFIIIAIIIVVAAAGGAAFFMIQQRKKKAGTSSVTTGF